MGGKYYESKIKRRYIFWIFCVPILLKIVLGASRNPTANYKNK